MRLLLRLSVVIVLAGLVAGFLLRRVLSVRRLPLLLALAGIPWLLHLVDVIGRASQADVPLGNQTTLFVTLSLLAGLISYGLSLWLLRRRLDAAALLPPLLGLLYGLGPLLWFSSVLYDAGTAVDNLAGIWLYGALLFMTAALWSFSFGRSRQGGRPVLPSLRRRR